MSRKKNFWEEYIIQDTGKLNYIDVATGVNKSLSLHFVTGTQIIIDRIRNEYKLICSSWSKMIEIDLNDYIKNVAYLDEITNSNIFPHLEVDSLLRIFANVGQGIVILE